MPRGEEQLVRIQVIPPGLDDEEQRPQRQQVGPGLGGDPGASGAELHPPVEDVGGQDQEESQTQGRHQPAGHEPEEGQPEDVKSQIQAEHWVRDLEGLGVPEAEDQLPLAAGGEGGEEAQDQRAGQEEAAEQWLDHEPAGQAEGILEFHQDVAAGGAGGQAEVAVHEQGKGHTHDHGQHRTRPEDGGEDGGQVHLLEPEVIGVQGQELAGEADQDEEDDQGTDERSLGHARLLGELGAPLIAQRGNACQFCWGACGIHVDGSRHPQGWRDGGHLESQPARLPHQRAGAVGLRRRVPERKRGAPRAIGLIGGPARPSIRPGIVAMPPGSAPARSRAAAGARRARP